MRSIWPRSSSRRSSASKRRRGLTGQLSAAGVVRGGSSGWGSARRPSARRMRCTSTPMTPEPSPWRRTRRWPAARGRASRLRAVPQRGGDLRAQLSRSMLVDADSAVPVAAVVLGDALAHGRQLGRAEEEPVEDELEDAAVLLGTWPASPPAPPGSPPARSRRSRAAPRSASSSSLVPSGHALARAAPRRTRASVAGREARRRGARRPVSRLAAQLHPTRSATRSRSVRCLRPSTSSR